MDSMTLEPSIFAPIVPPTYYSSATLRGYILGYYGTMLSYYVEVLYIIRYYICQ